MIKVGHHGSNSSTVEAFIDAVRPKVAIISVGSDNSYGHPHEAVLRRIQRYTPDIYRTDLSGEIICISDGSSLNIATER